jgi:hypothetical protein
MASKVAADLKDMHDHDGFTEGFSQVRHVMDEFRAQNPGTVYYLVTDAVNVFVSLVFVPGQAYYIVKFAGRTYFGDNYTHFMEAVKRVHYGAMGALLNHRGAVVCTDRHLSFPPAMRAALPLVHHRHDLRHIIENIKDMGYISKHMWAAQKATTYRDWVICMKDWIKEQPQLEAYLHPDNLNPAMWTYYTAVLDPHPHYLFALTGSQHVEGEMHRLKAMKVRHELPLKAITNFIELYVGIVVKNKAAAEKMVRDGKVLVTHLSLVIRRNLNKAHGYDHRDA